MAGNNSLDMRQGDGAARTVRLRVESPSEILPQAQSDESTLRRYRQSFKGLIRRYERNRLRGRQSDSDGDSGEVSGQRKPAGRSGIAGDKDSGIKKNGSENISAAKLIDDMDENFVAKLRVGEFICESKQAFKVGLRRLKCGRFDDGLNLRGRIIALSLFEGFEVASLRVARVDGKFLVKGYVVVVVEEGIGAVFADSGQDFTRDPVLEFLRGGQLTGEHEGVQAAFVDDESVAANALHALIRYVEDGDKNFSPVFLRNVAFNVPTTVTVPQDTSDIKTDEPSDAVEVSGADLPEDGAVEDLERIVH